MEKAETLLRPASALRDPKFADLLRAHGLLPETAEASRREIERLADEGAPAAMLYVADALRLGPEARLNAGDGVRVWPVYERDLDKAEGWYRALADRGAVHGIHGLGLIHKMRGEDRLAAETFEAAASRGHAPSMNQLAGMFARGEGVGLDTSRARDLWRRGARQGHIWSFRNLGRHGMRGGYGIFGVLAGFAALLSGTVRVPHAVFTDEYGDRLRL